MAKTCDEKHELIKQRCMEVVEQKEYVFVKTKPVIKNIFWKSHKHLREDPNFYI